MHEAGPPLAHSLRCDRQLERHGPVLGAIIGVFDPKDVEASHHPGGKPLPINHLPYFAPVAEPSLKTGIKAMSLAVLGAMQK